MGIRIDCWRAPLHAGATRRDSRPSPPTTPRPASRDGSTRWSRDSRSQWPAPAHRGTPTFHEGSLYTNGGRGESFNAWTRRPAKPSGARDLTEDTSAEVIEAGSWWGFASSPLDRRRAQTGKHWRSCSPRPRLPKEPGAAPAGDCGHRLRHRLPASRSGRAAPERTATAPLSWRPSGACQQVLGLRATRALESLDAATGDRLWMYDWNIGEFPRVRPADGPPQRQNRDPRDGLRLRNARRSPLSQDAGKLGRPKPSGNRRSLKPYFNDLVHHAGHLYGFDGKFFTCLDAADGRGDVAALRSSGRRPSATAKCSSSAIPGLLVIVTEKTGEVVLVEANAGDPRRERPIHGPRRQDLEPPGDRRRATVRSQRLGDGVLRAGRRYSDRVGRSIGPSDAKKPAAPERLALDGRWRWIGGDWTPGGGSVGAPPLRV